MPLIRLIAAVFLMSMKAAFFGSAHRYIPSRVRASSPGFIALAIAFFVASSVRYVLVVGETPSRLLFSQALYFALLLVLARKGLATELALYLAVSTGIDLVMAGAGLAGFDIQDPSFTKPAFIWEWAAAFFAVALMRKQRRTESVSNSDSNQHL